MGERQQSVRQRARRSALDSQSAMRARRAERERRCSALAVAVATALAERDAVVAGLERRAGEAIVQLTDVEGLSLREAVRWCGDALSFRDAARLRRLAGEPATDEQSGSGPGSGPAPRPPASNTSPGAALLGGQQ